MPLFRKKPVVIEAHRWFKNGDHPHDFSDRDNADGAMRREGLVVRRFRRPDVPGEKLCWHANCQRPMNEHGWIDTLEGGHVVCPGDWIITGVQGEHYPIKDAIFRETYEPANPCPDCKGNGAMRDRLSGAGLICGRCEGRGYLD
jgi:hypothetical protein